MSTKTYIAGPDGCLTQSDYRRFVAVQRAELLTELAVLKDDYERKMQPILKQLQALADIVTVLPPEPVTLTKDEAARVVNLKLVEKS